MSPLTDVPLQPGASPARELLRRELAERIYRDAEPGLLQRALDAVLHALGSLGGSGSALGRGVAAVVVLLLVAGVFALVVARTGRSSRRRRAASSSPVLGGLVRSAAQLHAAADDAAAAGRWEEAVTERFRAVVRALQERDLVVTSPGLTAGEAAASAAAVMPGAAASLRWAAGLFDGVVYGERSADPADDERLRDLARSTAGTRPLPPDRSDAPAAATR